jgi:hypothetical protein
LHFVLDRLRYLDPPHGENVAAEAVSHHPAHHSLGDVTNGLARIAYAKQVVNWIVDTILDYPLYIDDVEVAGKHQGFISVPRGVRIFRAS